MILYSGKRGDKRFTKQILRLNNNLLRYKMCLGGSWLGSVWAGETERREQQVRAAVCLSRPWHLGQARRDC